MASSERSGFKSLTTDIESSLLSTENLDRSSPELWPEQMPGVYSFAPLVSPKIEPSKNKIELEDIDHNLLYQFGSLAPLEIIEEVKKLQNVAYQLGLEEVKEMTRGKYLHILNSKKNSNVNNNRNGNNNNSVTVIGINNYNITPY